MWCSIKKIFPRVLIMPNTNRRRRRDETVESRRVVGVCTLPTRRNCFVASASAVWTQFATTADGFGRQFGNWPNRLCLCLFLCLTTWILIDTDNFFNSDDIMTSLFKKLSILIKIGVIKRYGVCLVSFKIVNRIRRQSSRIVCTPPTPTRQNSVVASAVCTHRRRESTVSSRRRRRCVLGLS